ncbi:MAG: domain S-box-containing protein [Bacteroidetes bacterium]|nr:domain S-box-containing protein [Bacteroidota bacterium]
MSLQPPPNKSSFPSFEKKLFVAFAFIVGVLILIFYFSRKNNNSLVESQKWVDHTKEVLYQSEKINYLFKGIEAESRGFLITGWNEFNSAFTYDTTAIKSHIRQLKVLTADNLKQQARVQALDSAINKRVIFALALMKLRQEKGYEEGKKLILGKEGVKLSERIAIIISAIQKEEQLLLQQRSLTNGQSIRAVKIITLLLQLVLFLVLLTVLLIVTSTLRQRARVQKELSESSSWFSNTLAGISDGIIATDIKGIVKFINPVAESLTGWKLEEVIGKPVNEIFNVSDEDSGEIQENPVHKTIKNRKATTTSHRAILMRKDKKAIAIDDSAAPVFNSQEELIGAVLVFRDVEKQRNAGKLLEQKVMERTSEVVKSEKRYRETLDAMLEGVQIIDKDWKYIYVNESLAKQGRNPASAYIGHTMMEIFPGIENSEVFKFIRQSMTEHKSFHVENEFVFPDNSKGYFELSIQPVPEGVFILSIDISERKRIEEEIKSMNANLEKKVVERTAQLETVNNELESFSYSVSHDLRAPLRAISGYATILSEDYGDKMDEEGKRVLNVITDNVNRMGQLINDLLHFARMGKDALHKTEINMDGLVKELVTEQQILLPDKKAEIEIKPLENIVGDVNMMRQVVANFLSNAIKYSSKKEKPEIEIGSYKKDNSTVFYVKDNGVGFDMKYYDKLFGVFQRLHNQKDFEGTGVGLALVRRIITRHEGKVWAESKINEGSTFYFSVPDNKI